MEKYIQTMKNADQECRKIADRVQRFTRDLHEIDSGTIYAVAYKAVKREELIEAFSAEIVPICEKAVKTIQSATDDAADFIKHIDLSNPADLSTALQIINSSGDVTNETIYALSEAFKGRRQCQIILNSALAARHMGEIAVYNPLPLIADAAAAIEAASHFANPSDLFRELLNAQQAFNRFYEESGVEDKADWDLPENEIMETKIRAAMGLLETTSGTNATA